MISGRSQLDIREAVPEDAEGIVAVLNPIIQAGIYTILDAPVTADAERAFIRRCSPRGVFLVAIDRTDHVLVGFQNTQPLVTYTHACDHVGETGTYVDLGRRRQGSRRSCSKRRSNERSRTATRRSLPSCAPTIRRHCRRICTMASGSSGRRAGTPRWAAGMSTRR